MATKPSETGNLLATEIGGYWGHIYVWSPGKQKPGPGRDCVISSHGGVASKSGQPVPGEETFYFYCPHGYAMTTSGGTTAKIAAREINFYEKIALNRLEHDYDLTKFQGTHGPKGRIVETYNDIQTGLTQAARQAEMRAGIQQRMIGATETEYNAIQETDMDVVTIRNRRVGAAPTLFGLIKQLHAAGFFYRQVHCGFCRVTEPDRGGWSLSNNRQAPER